MNHKLQKSQKEAVVTYFETISRSLPAGFEKSHETSVRIECLWAEIWKRNLLNMKQECYSNAFGQSACPPFQIHYQHSWVHRSSSSMQFPWGSLSKFLELQFPSSSFRKINFTSICTVTVYQKLT